jgi:hypothetical protein
MIPYQHVTHIADQLQANVDEYFAKRITHDQFTGFNRIWWDEAVEHGINRNVSAELLRREKAGYRYSAPQTSEVTV